jgi:hypothetical protein
MIVFDHWRLVKRHPREVAIEHEGNGRCCRREPWSVTARTLLRAMKPDKSVLVVTAPDQMPR